MEPSATAPTSTEAPPEPTATAGEPENAPQSTPEANGDGEQRERDESGRLLSREAANYRRQLRETQTERDSLREQLDSRDRVEAERLAQAAGLAVSGDIWAFGASLETLRDETGKVARETVEAAVVEIVKSRPGLKAPTLGQIGIGRGDTAAGRSNAQVGLSALLKPGRR